NPSPRRPPPTYGEKVSGSFFHLLNSGPKRITSDRAPPFGASSVPVGLSSTGAAEPRSSSQVAAPMFQYANENRVVAVTPIVRGCRIATRAAPSVLYNED